MSCSQKNGVSNWESRMSVQATASKHSQTEGTTSSNPSRSTYLRSIIHYTRSCAMCEDSHLQTQSTRQLWCQPLSHAFHLVHSRTSGRLSGLEPRICYETGRCDQSEHPKAKRCDNVSSKFCCHHHDILLQHKYRDGHGCAADSVPRWQSRKKLSTRSGYPMV